MLVDASGAVIAQEGLPVPPPWDVRESSKYTGRFYFFNTINGEVTFISSDNHQMTIDFLFFCLSSMHPKHFLCLNVVHSRSGAYHPRSF